MNQPQLESRPAREGGRYQVHGHPVMPAVEPLAALRACSNEPGQRAGQSVPGGLRRTRAAVVKCVIETPDFAVPGGSTDTACTITFRMTTLSGGDAQVARVS